MAQTALQEARDAVDQATTRAQVVVRPVTETDELVAMEALLAAVWEHPPGSVELDITLLAALARSGNYVAGAFRADELVGATAGFRCEPFPVTLHSHVTGVDRQRAATGTGTALKAYQRLWCLERGITGVRWTFDALQSRNARLNMGHLGADWVSFHVDYYGELRDGLNRGTGSDRLLLQWDLTRTAADRADKTQQPEPAQTLLARGPAGEPVLGTRPTTYSRLEIPTDIDGLRASDPELAQRWRDTLREVLPGLIADGWRVVDFDEDGAYVIAPPHEQEPR
ncbi:hypothetical protein NF556_16605 [Ornithinimicrobium faecis]|uniref:GNAT superfamily acetyltransferase n=1 Tax=Ornithinimicrobium faecis TaxID=2934158 RepID=A0ABY4YRM0_9MICO|nr:hypothetical protein [Ornithinimicrobium sp. HY1793]USQ79221.1 hypothetical protein NF556_16605 [Ornithinimicrobium sp. HY1793]